jgi:hypothetical protein
MNETAITKELVAICMMGGVIIWIEKDRAVALDALDKVPRGEWPQFIKVGDQKINPSRVEGIFTAQAMEEAGRRKNGEWQCQHGHWHDRFDKCGHRKVLGMVKAKLPNGDVIEYPRYE